MERPEVELDLVGDLDAQLIARLLLTLGAWGQQHGRPWATTDWPAWTDLEIPYRPAQIEDRVKPRTDATRG